MSMKFLLRLPTFARPKELNEKEKKRIYMRGYFREYSKTEKWKKYAREYAREYRKTPQNKAARAEYFQRPEVKAKILARAKTPHYRAISKAWRLSPKGIAWRKANYQKNKVRICAQHMEWYYRKKEKAKIDKNNFTEPVLIAVGLDLADEKTALKIKARRKERLKNAA